jgi:hypothetical protein
MDKQHGWAAKMLIFRPILDWAVDRFHHLSGGVAEPQHFSTPA